MEGGPAAARGVEGESHAVIGCACANNNQMYAHIATVATSPALLHLSSTLPALLLSTHLQVFKDATLFFSRGTPNLATVIPAMDHIDSILTTANVSHRKYCNAIRVACGLAKRVLDLYYSLTDSSTTYRIAMGKSFRFITTYRVLTSVRTSN